MNKKILLTCIAFVLLGLGFAAGGSYMLFGLEEKIPPDTALYNKLLTDEKARELYGILCGVGVTGNGLGYSYNEEDFKVSCVKHRKEQIDKWEELARSTKNPEIQARSLGVVGEFFYASAYDFDSFESARLAVQALEASLAHESGSMQDGLTLFDVERRETLEMARAKRAELEKKEEEQKQAQAQVPIPAKEGKTEDSHGRDVLGGTKKGEEELPIIAPGARP